LVGQLSNPSEALEALLEWAPAESVPGGEAARQWRGPEAVIGVLAAAGSAVMVADMQRGVEERIGRHVSKASVRGIRR
jgi:hypothetical protein